MSACPLVPLPFLAGIGDKSVRTVDGRAMNAASQKRHGCYYTPPALVERLLAATLNGAPQHFSICDPACGTGNILIAAARHGRVYGIERDPEAAAICRDRLRLSEQRIRCGDALFLDRPGEYDVVLGNPPWVSFGGRQQARATAYRRKLVAAYPV